MLHTPPETMVDVGDRGHGIELALKIGGLFARRKEISTNKH